MKNVELPLRCKLVDGVLSIEIGIETLKFAAENSNDFYDGEKDKFTLKISDAMKFAVDVALALNAEEEDGSTLVSKMLDLAIVDAVEDGSDGVEYDEEYV